MALRTERKSPLSEAMRLADEAGQKVDDAKDKIVALVSEVAEPEATPTEEPPEEPGEVDEDALLAAVGDSAMEQATAPRSTEYTDYRKARLEEDQAYLLAEVAQIDKDTAFLAARRDNLMLAFSGISADLMKMDS